jgi:hypothetical protein
MFELDSMMPNVLEGLYFLRLHALYYTNAHCLRGNFIQQLLTALRYSETFSSAQTESNIVGKTETHKACSRCSLK